MAEPINLNKVRKARARSEAAARAAVNRAAHGLTKVQKSSAAAVREKAAALLDAHKREP
jgi:hypothetical protein